MEGIPTTLNINLKTKDRGKQRLLSLVAAYFVHELSGPSFTALGQIFGRDIASLGRAGTRIMRKLPDNARLNSLIEEIRKELSELAKRQAWPDMSPDVFRYGLCY
ncbi:hypothetical protein JCM39068_20990 [Desulfocastanea catecholica]